MARGELISLRFSQKLWKTAITDTGPMFSVLNKDLAMAPEFTIKTNGLMHGTILCVTGSKNIVTSAAITTSAAAPGLAIFFSEATNTQDINVGFSTYSSGANVSIVLEPGRLLVITDAKLTSNPAVSSNTGTQRLAYVLCGVVR